MVILDINTAAKKVSIQIDTEPLTPREGSEYASDTAHYV